VNSDNFNNTCRGYVYRALQEMNATDEERRKIIKGLSIAFDLMTMEEARRLDRKTNMIGLKTNETKSKITI